MPNLRPLFLAAALTLTATAPAFATGAPAGVPGELPTFSADPATAQRQAVGCGIVGLGVAGVALASGTMATVGTAGFAAPASAVVGELLAYFGAGCSIGAFLATALPVMDAPADINLPVPVVPTPDRNRRVEAAELTP